MTYVSTAISGNGSINKIFNIIYVIWKNVIQVDVFG